MQPTLEQIENLINAAQEILDKLRQDLAAGIPAHPAGPTIDQMESLLHDYEEKRDELR